MRPCLLVLVVAVAALAACSGDRTDTTEVAGARADAADATNAVDARDAAGVGVYGAAEVPPAPLPAWFPEDVYLPADYVVAETSEGRGVHAVELRTGGEVFDVAGQARAAMLAAGWTENHYSPMDTRGGASMHYLKDDRSATLAMAWGSTGMVRVMYNFATVVAPAG